MPFPCPFEQQFPIERHTDLDSMMGVWLNPGGLSDPETSSLPDHDATEAYNVHGHYRMVDIPWS
jgi:hypothetical protein